MSTPPRTPMTLKSWVKGRPRAARLRPKQNVCSSRLRENQAEPLVEIDTAAGPVVDGRGGSVRPVAPGVANGEPDEASTTEVALSVAWESNDFSVGGGQLPGNAQLAGGAGSPLAGIEKAADSNAKK